ncbi:DUF1552 domain-containing protein [Nannocystis bainbridge]|uniref:DUF1552 domain-containing protein n=1 Tax=Nannocystis bainbridge TaxID=2995303 RepID=A0ABT5DZU1_9BACT|nr:DUF1552 domain-containing protein [Nannocystis bainbridge]MDC0718233.1 DUF1552 domain-containing protein [Nannocystis bainbridge]
MHGLGIGLVAAPFLNLLSAPSSRADGGPTAKRLIVFFSPNGTIPQQWKPSGTETNFSFPPGSILEPLTEIQDQLIVVEGLDFFGADNHEGGMAAMLTASGTASDESGGMSIDQYVAAQIGQDTRFSSLEFGVQTSAWGGGVQTRMSYSGPGAWVTPDDDPMHVYGRLFGDFMGGDEAAAALRARRQRVVDLLVDEATSLRGRLGSEERPKLDAHLDALAKVEKGLMGAVGCGLPDAPMGGGTQDNANFPNITAAQIDMMVAALACDMTRVASLQLSHTVSPTVCSWLGVSEGHHSLSHIDDSNVAGVAQFVECERWMAEQFKYLVQKLAMTPEADMQGSMLDNSVVVWAKEMGDSRLHTCSGVPFVIAGGAGGRWQTGRYLKFAGESHGKLMVSLCQAMGLSNETFGNSMVGNGPLPSLV